MLHEQTKGQGAMSEEVTPGRSVSRQVLTTDLDGGEVALTIHQVQGAKPGPTVAVVATVHGNEWFYIEVVRQFLASLKPESLTGTVLAIPVANPIAFGQLARATPDASDTPDLNRAFPGHYTSITEQLAAAIETCILQRSDFLIQYDCGPWGWAIGEVMYGNDYPNADVSERSRAMAIAYGYPLVRSGALFSQHPGPRSLAGYAGAKYSIPSIMPEIGGSGFGPDIEAEWIASNVSGTRGALQHLQMLDGDPERPSRTYVCRQRARINPSVAGMVEPCLGAQDLGQEVEKGQLLALVRDPYTFDLREELRAPDDGWLFYVARAQPVRPGDFTVGIMIRDSAEPVSAS